MPDNGHSIFMPQIAEVVSTQQLTDMEKYIELKLKEPVDFDFNPGQFIQISIFGIGEAPISISSSPFNKTTIGICVRKPEMSPLPFTSWKQVHIWV